MREIVLVARAQRALVDLLARLQGSGHVQELLPSLRLELAPELVRAPKQRHVGGVLEVAEPDDAGDPVRGAELVRNVEALQAEHALPAAGEVVERRAAHSADPHHDDVVSLHPA